MKAISLFSGAGGLDLGFKEAGVDILWANDFNKDACATYNSNIGQHIECGDINHFKADLKSYKNKLDIIFGGPPCQGFSVAGKMNPDDERSEHIWNFAEIVDSLQPKAFVMENVKALGQLKKWEPLKDKLLEKFRESGYMVNYAILNASDYNVPQARERVFFIGFKGNPSIIPDIEEMMKKYKVIAPTVRESLKVLDKAGTGNNKSVCKAKITITANPILRKSPYAGMLFNGAGRPVKLDGYCATLPASMGGNKTPIIDEIALYENGDSWIESYHKGIRENGEQPLSYQEAPKFLRRLTVEEAAILQSFPIDYSFKGSQSSIFKQIGNAVPPKLGLSVAKMVLECLKDSNLANNILNIPVQLRLIS